MFGKIRLQFIYRRLRGVKIAQLDTAKRYALLGPDRLFTRRPVVLQVLIQLPGGFKSFHGLAFVRQQTNGVFYQTVLAKWQKYQRKKREWQNQDMVNNVGREFKRHLKWAGIKPIGTLSIHTLRKCCGKSWADHLPPNVTKELMGHSNIATTMKYYNQVDKDQRKKAAAVVEDLIFKANTEPNQAKVEAGRQKQSDAKMTPEANLRVK